MDGHDVVELIKAVTWPATVVWLVNSLREPIVRLMRTIGRRATKLKLYDFELELGKLVAASGTLSATVDALQQAVVQASGSSLLIKGITDSAAADYTLLALSANGQQAWISSRLFLLSALLDRNRVVRCIVFTEEDGSFVGAASPRDIHGQLGAKYPEYEHILLEAYGLASNLDAHEFRNGVLGETAILRVAEAFLYNTRISSYVPPVPASGWMHLDRSAKPETGPSTWELAEAVTAANLRAMLRERLATGSVVRVTGGEASAEATRAIINHKGAFVAILSATGKFEDLCDRALIVDDVARSAMLQAESV